MDSTAYKHYVRTDVRGCITYGFTDAFEQPHDGDILHNDSGGRHFQLIFADGSLKPPGTPLKDAWDAPLYKLVDGFAELRPPEELEVEKVTILIHNLRVAALEAAGRACTQAIHGGIEVEGARYSLTEHDQIELMAQLSAVKDGAETVPYHADGELCRMYTAAAFLAVAQAATAHILYHRTYCNHINAWIRRAETAYELEAIQYGEDLPTDLAASMMALLEEMGSDG